MNIRSCGITLLLSLSIIASTNTAWAATYNCQCYDGQNNPVGAPFTVSGTRGSLSALGQALKICENKGHASADCNRSTNNSDLELEVLIELLENADEKQL